MENRDKPWRYEAGTRLVDLKTGVLYIIDSPCQKGKNGKYGYDAKDTLNRKKRVTLEDLMMQEKYKIL